MDVRIMYVAIRITKERELLREVGMRSIGSLHSLPLDSTIRAVQERNMTQGNKSITGNVAGG